MSRRTLRWAALVVGVSVPGAIFGYRASTEGSLIQAVIDSRDEAEAAKNYDRLFSHFGRDRLSALKSCSNDGIALQAAWQEVIDQITDLDRARLPKEELYPRLPADATDRFLRFLEDRLRAPTPQWWRESLAAGRIVSPSYISYPGPKQYPYQASEFGNVWATEGTRITQDGQTVRIATAQNALSLPASTFRKERGNCPYSQLSVCLGAERSYLVFHDNCPGGYGLLCLDTDTGSIDWRSDVWGQGSRTHGVSGQHSQYVSVRTADDRVIVYGAGTSMFVEEFGSRTGKILGRFNTVLWYWDSLTDPVPVSLGGIR
jgi:hypothetical protein